MARLSIINTNSAAALIALVLVAIAATSESAADPLEMIWENSSFSCDSSTTVRDVLELSDQRYLLCGSQSSVQSWGYVQMLGLSGDSLWNVFLTTDSLTMRRASEVKVTNDSTIVCVGSSPQGPTIAKLNTLGQLLSMQVYDEFDNQDIHESIAVDSNGGAVVACSGFFDPSGLDVAVFKTSESGVIQWHVELGSLSGNESIADIIYNSGSGFSVLMTQQHVGEGVWLLLVHLNSDGTTLRTDTIATLPFHTDLNGYKVRQTVANDFIVNYSFNEPPPFGTDYNIKLMRLSEHGDVIWNRSYGSSRSDECFDFDVMADGTIVQCGYAYPLDAQLPDALIMGIDSEGDSLWSMTIGSPRHDVLNAIQVTSQNEILLGGERVPLCGDGNNYEDWTSLFSVSTSISPQEPPESVVQNASLLQNYPNPFNSSTTIRLLVRKHGRYKVELVNILGQTIKEIVDRYFVAGEYQYEVRASGFSSGTIYCRLTGLNADDVAPIVLVK